MSRLPEIRRLMVEDFLDQKEWIGALFSPINLFQDGVISALNKGISIRDKVAGDIIRQTATKSPTDSDIIILPWNPKLGQPVAIYIGDVKRVDGNPFVAASAFGLQWKYVSSVGIAVTNLLGVTPSNDNKYLITYVIFAG